MDKSVILTPENTVMPLRQGGKHLRESFDDNGLLYELPKVIQNEAGMYEVVVGRWRVKQILFTGGYDTMEAELVEWDTEQAAVANLSSNMTASTNWQVDPWDVRLLIKSGKEQKEVARLIGCSAPKISQLMSVFSLSKALQDKVKSGELEGRDNIIKCNRLPKRDQNSLAKRDGKITAKHINELLHKKKVKPIEDVEEMPKYDEAFADNGSGYNNDGLSFAGSRLDNLLAGEPVETEIDGHIYVVQVIEVKQ